MAQWLDNAAKVSSKNLIFILLPIYLLYTYIFDLYFYQINITEYKKSRIINLTIAN